MQTTMTDRLISILENVKIEIENDKERKASKTLEAIEWIMEDHDRLSGVLNLVTSICKEDQMTYRFMQFLIGR